MTQHAHQPLGITHPPIDDLLTKVDSKYRLVLFAAKRARQINAYYNQLGEGLLENVGPLVETGVQEKPLSIAMREINSGLLDAIEIDPEAEEAARKAVVSDPEFAFGDFGSVASLDHPVADPNADFPSTPEPA